MHVAMNDVSSIPLYSCGYSVRIPRTSLFSGF